MNGDDCAQAGRFIGDEHHLLMAVETGVTREIDQRSPSHSDLYNMMRLDKFLFVFGV
jgi:hypothetical protein